ncbi:MAG: TetR/AcrR family transcriptional regulator [Candidatus Acidiferrales bacterium]|jgi:AcrR family transcriptional regulator
MSQKQQTTRPLEPAPPESRPAKVGRRERRSAEIRERLFRAALRLFASRGFAATTVEDITEAADVGKGTFFNYFPGKEHLLIAFGEIRREKVRAALEQAQKGAEPIHLILRRLYHALAEEPAQTQEMARSMVITMLASEPVRKLVCERMEDSRRLARELMFLGQRRGEIRRDREPAELAHLFQESFFGSLLLWTLEPPAPLGPKLGLSFSQLWSGIAAQPIHRSKRKSE